MKENNIGLAFRIIGTLYICTVLATIAYKLGPMSDTTKAIIGILLGGLCVFLLWVGVEKEDDNVK
jgi:hypothetical protein